MIKYEYICKDGQKKIVQDDQKIHEKIGLGFIVCTECCNQPVTHLIERSHENV